MANEGDSLRRIVVDGRLYARHGDDHHHQPMSGCNALSEEELADAYPWLDPEVAEALGLGNVEEEPIEVFRRVEKLAILAEQHPECFSVEERLEIESSYRQWLRWRESQ